MNIVHRMCMSIFTKSYISTQKQTCTAQPQSRTIRHRPKNKKKIWRHIIHTIIVVIKLERPKTPSVDWQQPHHQQQQQQNEKCKSKVISINQNKRTCALHNTIQMCLFERRYMSLIPSNLFEPMRERHVHTHKHTQTIEHFGSINFDTNKEMVFFSVNFCARKKK